MVDLLPRDTGYNSACLSLLVWPEIDISDVYNIP